MNTTRHTNLSEKKFTTTDNEFQDLHWAIAKIERKILKNKHNGMGTSISGLFNFLRRERHLSLIGDYSLFWAIVQIFNKRKLPIHTLNYALPKSEEYRSLTKSEKMKWGNLLKSVNNESKNNNYAFSKAEKEKKV